ncbi:MAG: VOC family protein [Sphingomonadales bacterium]|nr:VOC family protein [Sphingomonadales bacterium]
MAVAGLDHVNIIAADLDATVAFYSTVLGLVRDPNSVLEKMGRRGAWMQDTSGHPIMHIQGYDAALHKANQAGDVTPTGAIDHVALQCSGFAAMLEHLAALGIEHRVNDRQFGNLRQIFVTDPDRVTLELNYHAD